MPGSEKELIELLEELVESLPPPPPYWPGPIQTASISESPTALSAQTSNLGSEIDLRQWISSSNEQQKMLSRSINWLHTSI